MEAGEGGDHEKKGHISFLLVHQPEEEQTTCWHLHGNQRRGSARRHIYNTLITCIPVHSTTEVLPSTSQSFFSFYFVATPLFLQQDNNRVGIPSKYQTPRGRLVFLSVRDTHRANVRLAGEGGANCFKMNRGGGGTRCLFFLNRQKPENTTAAAPQQTNQPIRTEGTHRCTHTPLLFQSSFLSLCFFIWMP